MASEFFGRQRRCRFYTAGCGNKMAVSVTGPHAANELVGPVIPGNKSVELVQIKNFYRANHQKYDRSTVWDAGQTLGLNCQ